MAGSVAVCKLSVGNRIKHKPIEHKHIKHKRIKHKRIKHKNSSAGRLAPDPTM
jgi:hypothetical protein